MTLSLSHSTQPTRVRWRILFLLLLISIITYIDRVNISVTARHMMPSLGLTDVQMGWIFSAFVFGYALFQVPGAMRLQARHVPCDYRCGCILPKGGNDGS